MVLLGAVNPNVTESGPTDSFWWLAGIASGGALWIYGPRGLLAALGFQVAYLGASELGAGSAAPAPWGAILALAVIAYALGAREPAARGRPALAALVGGMLLLSDGSAELTGAIAAVLWLLVAYAFGLAIGTGERRRHAMDELARRREASREEWIRGAVEAERACIARDLHDALGHSVSLIVLQAGAVRTRLEPHQHAERAALLATERTGRESVEELRRMVQMLRSPAGGTVVPASLAALGELVDSVRSAGVTVTVATTGSPVHLPPSVDVTSYRIIQEALTNIAKHAPRAHATVALDYQPGLVTLEIRDDGGGHSATMPHRDGHGLIGMRERVALYSGTLSAGPLASGGFAIRAALPTGAASAA